MASRTSPNPLPLPYRAFFLYIEPFFTLLGALYAFFLPRTYLDLTDPLSTPLANPFGATVPRHETIILNQLANLYFCFALNEALVLRATSDLRVWRLLLVGLLVADFGHLWSVHAMGWETYWRVWEWNEMGWGNLGFVYVGATMRVCFLSGVGLGGGAGGGKGRGGRKRV